MVNKELIALMNSILQVLDQEGPSLTSCHRCRAHRHRWCNAAMHWQESRTTLDLERNHRTEGIPGQPLHGKHYHLQSTSLTLGLGFWSGSHLPSHIHRPIGRWSPQTHQPLREDARNRHVTSTVGALAPTRLCRGAWDSHHRDGRGKGRESQWKRRRWRPHQNLPDAWLTVESRTKAHRADPSWSTRETHRNHSTQIWSKGTCRGITCDRIHSVATTTTTNEQCSIVFGPTDTAATRRRWWSTACWWLRCVLLVVEKKKMMEAESFTAMPNSPPLVDPIANRGLGISRTGLECRMGWGWG
jgi:hypothetical protein